jgi:hypothetical protein
MIRNINEKFHNWSDKWNMWLMGKLKQKLNGDSLPFNKINKIYFYKQSWYIEILN